MDVLQDSTQIRLGAPDGPLYDIGSLPPWPTRAAQDAAVRACIVQAGLSPAGFEPWIGDLWAWALTHAPDAPLWHVQHLVQDCLATPTHRYLWFPEAEEQGIKWWPWYQWAQWLDRHPAFTEFPAWNSIQAFDPVHRQYAWDPDLWGPALTAWVVPLWQAACEAVPVFA
jgi:hypothetical protein